MDTTSVAVLSAPLSAFLNRAVRIAARDQPTIGSEETGMSLPAMSASSPGLNTGNLNHFMDSCRAAPLSVCSVKREAPSLTSVTYAFIPSVSRGKTSQRLSINLSFRSVTTTRSGWVSTTSSRSSPPRAARSAFPPSVRSIVFTRSSQAGSSPLFSLRMVLRSSEVTPPSPTNDLSSSSSR